jgi:hypothetical protein
MDNLDEFLKGQEAPEAAETPEAAPEPEVTETPEAKAERERDEKGRFKPKGEEAAPPAAEEQHSIPPKALQEERRKRQGLEQQLAELTARLQQPQTPPPSIWEDEQGWQQHFGGQVVSEAVNAATLNARLDMSEMMVRQSHEDFEDKKAQFLEMMKETPGLQQKAIADPHPWNFAYNYVTNHQRMQELSATNVSELEAKLREQIKAELAAEQKPAAPSPEVPDTLADAQSARGGGGQPLHVPTLDEILGRK